MLTPEQPDSKMQPPVMGEFTAPLLSWYQKNARQLPWRVSPEDFQTGRRADPYRVWLSEIMLQQTQVATVKAYYEKFLEYWPKLEALACADEEDILKQWAGLGYYSRARNLKKCAGIVARDYGGKFPQSIKELKKLPGIGDYTAAAIASIAFDKSEVVIDGNIERVAARFFAITTPLPKSKPEIRQKLSECIPEKNAGELAQAMMDLGAMVCTPKKPQCNACPLHNECAAYRQGLSEQLPYREKKPPKPTRKGAVFIIVKDKNVWLQRRPISDGNGGMLAGMTQFPTTDWSASQDGETGKAALPFAANWQRLGTIRHTFTHFHLELEIWQTEIQTKPLLKGWWAKIITLHEEALPSLMKKAISKALPDVLL